MSSPTPLAAACNAFSLRLFKQLSENDTGNLFYSPLSVSSALAMVLLGARGSTATQMAEVLHLKDDLHMDFSKLMGDLLLNKSGKSCSSYALSLANRLYGEQSHRFAEEFLSATREHFDAQPESVDFIGNAEEARLNVNRWVQKRTHGKIKDLLSPGAVDAHTRLVLVNAVYFNAKWKEPFREFENGVPFRLSKTKRKPVKMMYQTTEFPHASIPEVGCQILELPYEGEELSMLIFLPSEDDTTGLEKELTYERFMAWTHPGNMRRAEVSLGLPCFKMEAAYDMKDVLIKMGMVDAFDVAKSDFSGMSPADDTALSKVVHKAFVEVNEEGTKAAAATAAGGGMMMALSDYVPPIYFIVNHPFLFFIRHNPTTSVLFAGRYCSPPGLPDQNDSFQPKHHLKPAQFHKNQPKSGKPKYTSQLHRRS